MESIIVPVVWLVGHAGDLALITLGVVTVLGIVATMRELTRTPRR